MQKQTKKPTENAEQLKAKIREEIAKRGVRAFCLAHKVKAEKEVIKNPVLLEGIAIELRSVAYQIRALQDALMATEEA